MTFFELTLIFMVGIISSALAATAYGACGIMDWLYKIKNANVHQCERGRELPKPFSCPPCMSVWLYLLSFSPILACNFHFTILPLFASCALASYYLTYYIWKK